jgi:hypothetical protein
MIDATLPKLGKRGPYKTAEKGWNPYDVSLSVHPLARRGESRMMPPWPKLIC